MGFPNHIQAAKPDKVHGNHSKIKASLARVFHKPYILTLINKMLQLTKTDVLGKIVLVLLLLCFLYSVIQSCRTLKERKIGISISKRVSENRDFLCVIYQLLG